MAVTGGVSVSVVVATYNRAQHVVETVSDILAQDDFGGCLEVIVVDDGSTDGTKEAMRPLSGRIIYRRISHAGRPSVPRNVGLQLATGEFVAFQDDDDLWVREKLRLQCATMRSAPEIVMSYGNCEFITADGRRTGKLLVSPDRAASGHVVRELLVGNFIPLQTPLIRAEVLRELGGFDEARSLRGIEDYELWLRVADRGVIQYEGRVLAYYRDHAGQISRADDDTIRRRVIAVYTRALRRLGREHRPLVRRRLAEAYIDWARQQHSLRTLAPKAAVGAYYVLRMKLERSRQQDG